MSELRSNPVIHAASPRALFNVAAKPGPIVYATAYSPTKIFGPLRL